MAPSPPPYGYAQYGRRALQSELGVTVDATQRAALDAAVAGLGTTPSKWAACTDSLVAAGAPLPCRTSGNPIRCMDGARHCGTAEENTHEPYLELDFHDYKPDFNGRMYFFLVSFRLPPAEELARLVFHPLAMYGGDVVENRGWRLTVYDDHHNPLPVQCQDWNYGASATEYTEGLVDLHHVCLKATASDAEYEVLSRARFLRVTLIGNFRQIWFDNVRVYFRAITDLKPGTNDTYIIADAPPPSPPPPAQAPSPPTFPDPPAPPPTTCTFYPNEVKTGWETHIVMREPCGLTEQQCCALAEEHNRAMDPTAPTGWADAYVLSATGCCVLVSLGGGAAPWVPTLDGSGAKVGWEAYQTGAAGTGVLASVG